MHKTDENSADEEVVVSFQGILCRKDIAPFNEKNMWAIKDMIIYIPMLKVPLPFRPSGKVKYLRQSATLTAFGNPVFNKPIESIAAIFSIFKRAVGDRLAESPVHSTYEEFPAIDVTNRYFTPRGGADPVSALRYSRSPSFVRRYTFTRQQMEDQYNIEEYQPLRREIYPGENRVHSRLQELTTPQEAFMKSLDRKSVV